MRIIAGKAKGVRLEAPKGQNTRPTLDRVREALFSILTPMIEGAGVLDLYAGTGAIGIEALSRGAARCDFVENDAECAAILQRNLAAAKVETQARIHRLHLPDQLSRINADSLSFDLIYADPPFESAQYALLCSGIPRQGLLKPNGFLVIEHPSKKALNLNIEGLTCDREAKYGATCLSFFSLKNDYPNESQSE